jgi:outer membrane protein assembly factor BamB
VYCFDATTGKTIWTSSPISDLAKSPAVANGKVFVTTDFGFTSVYAFDANTGSQLWTNGSSFGFPETELVAHEGMLYLGTGGGSVDGYYLNNGKLVTYTIWGTAMQMDYGAILAAYDTDTKQASYPAHNGEQ